MAPKAGRGKGRGGGGGGKGDKRKKEEKGISPRVLCRLEAAFVHRIHTRAHTLQRCESLPIATNEACLFFFFRTFSPAARF